MKRVRQLYSALTARLDGADKAFIRNSLDSAQQLLFLKMSKGDQKHAVRVAYTAERLAAVQGQGDVDIPLLRRCALLHDIGRGYEAGTPWAKTLAVLLRGMYCSSCSNTNKSYLERIMYRHYYHPQLGAAMLRELGLEREAVIVEKHHQPEGEDDCVELVLLRQADEMN